MATTALYIGTYNGQATFRNLADMKQFAFHFEGKLPEIGTKVKVIFGIRHKVIFKQPRNQEKAVEVAMTSWARKENSRAIGRAIHRPIKKDDSAKAKIVMNAARQSYHNALKYGYHC